MLRKFFAANSRLCEKLEPYLPQARTNIFGLYEKTVARYMNSRVAQVVVDVGGGKSCGFAKYRDPGQRVRIIAVDVSDEELKHNTDVDETKVANIVQGLPFEAEEVDLIVSSSVLEHLPDLHGFIASSSQALKKGGYYIHRFPSKFAPFALINQALPQPLARKLLYFFKPESEGICGFPAYYNNCYYSAITELLEKHDFEIADLRLSYYQSQYYKFFAPLFLVSALYEALIQTIGAKNLCAHLLVIARKK
jgi:SAM-dependent methyltransferase